ncbi:MAG: transporter [Archangium sp.]
MVRIAVVSSLFFASVALACPTCTCANPALTTIGADRPFDNRIRLSSSIRAWEQREGVQQVNATVLRELRMDLTATWSPTSRWTFLVNLPLQVRERTEVSLARERGFGTGEIDLSARALLIGVEGLRPRHLLSVVAGVRLPTAPTLHAADGTQLNVDAQLGPGSFVPNVGLLWSAFIGDQWSTFVSLMGEVPIEGRYGLRVGPGVQALAAGQFQPWKWLGFRLGVDTRYEFPSYLRGVEERYLSGFLLQPLADVIVSPVSRVLIVAGVRVPVVDTRPGPVWSSPTLLASVVVDI